MSSSLKGYTTYRILYRDRVGSGRTLRIYFLNPLYGTRQSPNSPFWYKKHCQPTVTESSLKYRRLGGGSHCNRLLAPDRGLVLPVGPPLMTLYEGLL